MRAGTVSMRARYETSCDHCQRKIRIRDRVVVIGLKQYMHRNCHRSLPGADETWPQRDNPTS